MATKAYMVYSPKISYKLRKAHFKSTQQTVKMKNKKYLYKLTQEKHYFSVERCINLNIFKHFCQEWSSANTFETAQKKKKENICKYKEKFWFTFSYEMKTLVYYI